MNESSGGGPDGTASPLKQTFPKEYFSDTFVNSGDDAALFKPGTAVPRLRPGLVNLRRTVQRAVSFVAQEGFEVMKHGAAHAPALMLRQHVNVRDVRNRRPQVLYVKRAEQVAPRFGDDDFLPLHFTPQDVGGDVGTLPQKIYVGGGGEPGL